MKVLRRLTLAFLILAPGILFNSCKEESVIDVSEFVIDEDYHIELVAAEPLVVLPVAMTEDADNRLWVVEMPGYMRDIDGSNEEISDGRIIILSDEDRDGQMDQRTVFLDSLLNPRAVLLVYDGLLYTDGTFLKWTEIINDKPENTIVVDSFYVVGGNIEHQPNGLLYNIDNWIYSAKSNVRYRRISGIWKKEATAFRGQWGISTDRFGRLIYNHNSAPLIGDRMLPNQMMGNPHQKHKNFNGRYLTDDMSIYPIQATSVNRGYMPNVLDSVTKKVLNYTSACAPHLYYGDQLGDEYYGSAFVCAPEGNLIANYIYDEENLTARRVSKGKEFLVSMEESFRPVNLMTGFDGSLYVVDMRKGIIQHSAYMSSYLRDNILSKGLEKINGLGRIYRVSKKDSHNEPQNLTNLDIDQLIDLFKSENLDIRRFAQKELITRRDSGLESALLRGTRNDNINVRFHSLWTLEGLNAFSLRTINSLIEEEKDLDILIQFIPLSQRSLQTGEDLIALYTTLFNIGSRRLDLHLATAVGFESKCEDLWLKIATKYPNDTLMCEALVNSSTGKEKEFPDRLSSFNNALIQSMLNEVIQNKESGETFLPRIIEEPFDDDRTNGLKKFKTYCVSCHGYDGNGIQNLAPSFKNSEIITGEETKIASIILNGFTRPNSNYKLMMPAYKEDKNMADQDVVDIVSYLKSTFTDQWSSLTLEEVIQIRKTSENQNF